MSGAEVTLHAGCYSHAASFQATASATTAAHSAAVTSDPRIDPVSVSSGRVTGAGQDQNRNCRNSDRDGSRIGKWSRLRTPRRHRPPRTPRKPDARPAHPRSHGDCPGRRRLRHPPNRSAATRKAEAWFFGLGLRHDIGPVDPDVRIALANAPTCRGQRVPVRDRGTATRLAPFVANVMITERDPPAARTSF